MPGLRSTTLLFVLLLLAPAAILAFLGFRASSSLVQELRRAARDEAVRAAQDAAAVLPAALAAAALDDGARLAAVAAQVRERLPLATAGAVLRALDAPGGGALFVRGAEGRAIAPAGPLAPRPDGLPEWPRFCAVRARCDRGERGAPVADAAASLVTPALRAAALALAWRDDAEAAAAALAPLPFAVLAQAGPLAVEALARSTGGRPRLAAACADGALDDVPATEAARLRWLGAAGAGEDALARQRLRALAEAGGAVLAASAWVEPGVRVEEWVAPAAWIERCLPRDAGAPCALAAVRTDRLQPPHAPGPAAASVSVATPLGPVEVTATHRGIAAIEAAARRERWLTGAGIALLLLTMVAGVALVRRALLRERRAAQLRDDFIANVSHDLRTPLTSLRMHAEMLGSDELDPAARRRYAAVADAEAARLSALVEDLLDFAALARGRRRLEPEPVDLARAADSLLAGFQPLAQRGGVTLVHVCRGEAAALVDPVAFVRIAANLLQNALRHGRPPRRGEPPRIEVCTGPGPVLEVRDNGPGVPPALRSRLFERFERAPHAGPGLGLGLSLARALARASGGDLTHADHGDATAFRLVLPAVPAVGDDPAPEVPP